MFFLYTFLLHMKIRPVFFSAVHGGHMMIQKDVSSSWYPDEAAIKPGSDF